MKINIIKIIIIIIFLTGLFNLLFANYEYENFNFLNKLTVFILYIVCFLPIFFYVFKNNYINLIPLFPLSMVYFLVCYISIYFFNVSDFFTTTHATEKNLAKGTYILLYGILSMFLGFTAIFYLFTNYHRNGFQTLNLTKTETFIYGLFLTINSIILFYFFNIQIIFPQIAQIKYPILLLGFGLLLKSLYESKKILSYNVITIIIVKFIIIIFEISTGSYAFPFILLILDLTYFFYLKKNISIKGLVFIMLVILMFLFAHAGKYEFRAKTWGNSDLNTLSKIKIIFSSYKKIVTVNFNFRFDENFKINEYKYNDIETKNFGTFDRIFHSFVSLIIVTNKSPEPIPYWNGYSYKILSTKIIPRVFWKDKPSDTLGNEFGHRYGVLTSADGEPVDKYTSWNMPVLNEFYVNYGTKGVIFGMLIIGILFGIITRFFSFSNKSNIESTIAIYIFIPLFFLESHLSLLLGSVIQSYIFLMLSSTIFILLLRKIRDSIK